MLTYLKKIQSWIVLAVAITFIFGFIFACVHQVIRTEANNSVNETGQNVLTYLKSEQASKDAIDQSTKVDLASSNQVFIILYGQDKQVSASSATLDGKTPEIPSGVFDNVKNKGISKLTWEPKKNLRQAIIIYPVDGNLAGYLVVGRSLKDSEENITRISKILALGWILTILVTLLTFVVLDYLTENLGKSKMEMESSKKEGLKNAKMMDDKEMTEESGSKMETMERVEMMEPKPEPKSVKEKLKKAVKTHKDTK